MEHLVDKVLEANQPNLALAGCGFRVGLLESFLARKKPNLTCRNVMGSRPQFVVIIYFILFFYMSTQG
jgi:hypothetical protein